MKTITAGEALKIKIQAKDDQSGLKYVEVEAENLKDFQSSPRFEAKTSAEWPIKNDTAEINLVIPEFITTSKWKISAITLTNGVGRTIKYFPGKDFEPILFMVTAKEGIDLTPAELLKVELID